MLDSTGAVELESESPGVRVLAWSRSLSFVGDCWLLTLSVSSVLMCNSVAVSLTFVQFILQLKLCLYTIVQLLLEEWNISLKSSLIT